MASLGGTHALVRRSTNTWFFCASQCQCQVHLQVASPDGRWRSLDGRHVASSAEEQLRSKALLTASFTTTLAALAVAMCAVLYGAKKALGAEIIGEEKGKGVVGAPFAGSSAFCGLLWCAPERLGQVVNAPG